MNQRPTSPRIPRAMTTEEKAAVHADCPAPVWNGTSWECRNHSPYIEVPQLRTPTKQLKAPSEQGTRRPAQAPMGLPQALKATEREQKAGRDERNILTERMDTAEGDLVTLERELMEVRDERKAMAERIQTLEDSIGVSHITDNVVHVQKLYGRVLALEEAGTAPEPDVIKMLAARILALEEASTAPESAEEPPAGSFPPPASTEKPE